jgi:hypothetical protein
MAKQPKRKPKIEQKPDNIIEEARKRDALALAELIYDIYQGERFKEVTNASKGKGLRRVQEDQR